MLSRTALTSAFRQSSRHISPRPVVTSAAAWSPSARSQQPATFRIQSPQQLRFLSEATRSAIEKAVGTKPVVLFMKGTPDTPQCGFSKASVQILGINGVDPDKFAAFNVLEDDELRQGIKEFSEWPTIPQLYVDKEFVGGCDILMSMHQDGTLAKMLEEKGVLVPVAEEETQKGDRS
ncbi:thioredoxin-like protein [Lineolata rhizophorae]|uniref:Monothiol glutaredoxin-5, mitochondrial n=1 Tax=Lineolata rhizophorae TaxID=578093 RepID=A0A6A6PD04_9PEZI|nr:thioredoxin-like protein [Lineolata rhizophorae]